MSAFLRSPPRSLSKMDRIPIEILEMIFDRIPVGQLDACLRVCKKWQFTIDRLINLGYLVVYSKLQPVNQTFFHTNERVSLRFCIHLDDFTELELKKGIYRKFRRLCYYDHFENYRLIMPTRFSVFMGGAYSFFNMKMLNYLNQVEELHLGPFKSDELKEPHILSLPNLKILSTWHYMGRFLKLDAPKLTNWSITLCNSGMPNSKIPIIQLVHPETIDTLKAKKAFAWDLFRVDSAVEFLMSLTGLKFLLIEGRTKVNLELIRRPGTVKFLSDRLKEIHFLKTMDLESELCWVIRELKKQAESLKIYLNGLEVNCLREWLDESTQEAHQKCPSTLALESSYQLDFYLANSSELTETLPFCRVNYNLIEQSVRNGLDHFGVRSDLYFFSVRRLPRLEIVTVDGKQVHDELAFARWLRESNTLLELIFRGALSQEFYSNTLPASCPTLPYLCFRFDAPLDFSFLLQFKFLHRIEFSRPEYRLVERLFPNLAYLKYLAFYEMRNGTRRVGLGVLKRENENNVTYELYDGQEVDSIHLFRRFVPVKTLDSFDELVHFTNEFTGF